MVAGLGVGAGIFYYRSLVNAHQERGLVPRIVMVHADARQVMSLSKARERLQLARYLKGLLQQMADSGADIATIPAFAPQVCAQELEEITPLPLIGLLDTIVLEIQRRQWRSVGILGAHVTMETELFGRLASIAQNVPLPESDRAEAAAVYTRIVEREGASPGEFETLRSLADGMLQRGADGILLAGTDLSFVFRPDNTDFPHLDGARIHIDEILREMTD